jgi:hypothetical protein
MVKTSLVEADLIAGWRLLLRLHTPPNLELFRVKAALWLYYPESEEWRLVIATPLVDEKGPLNTYARLQVVLQRSLLEIQPADLYLQNIAVIGASDPLVKPLRRAMNSAPKVSYVRLNRSSVGRIYVEDAYLYRVPPSTVWTPREVGMPEKRGQAQARPR